jgi:hypothetical protein
MGLGSCVRRVLGERERNHDHALVRRFGDPEPPLIELDHFPQWELLAILVTGSCPLV